MFEAQSFTFSLAVLALAATLFFVFVRPALSLAPWVPTRKEDYEKINELAALQNGQTFYELGCGDGRVAAYIAQKNPSAHVIGIELSLVLYATAYLRKVFGGYGNWSVRYGNALHTNLQNADAVYAFALPHTVKDKLLPKLEQELRPKTRFISYAFPIKGTDRKVVSFTGEKHTIFLTKF